MKHFFVDTNIIVDLLAARDGFFKGAASLFRAAMRKKISLSVSSLSYATVFYLLRKQVGKDKAI